MLLLVLRYMKQNFNIGIDRPIWNILEKIKHHILSTIGTAKCELRELRGTLNVHFRNAEAEGLSKMQG